jgi:hypothetical protein
MTTLRLLVTDETTVGEVLEASPATEVIFEAYGCNPTWECTDEHRSDYQIVDLSLTCHIRDTDSLVADLNAFLELEAAEANSLGVAA